MIMTIENIIKRYKGKYIKFYSWLETSAGVIVYEVRGVYNKRREDTTLIHEAWDGKDD